MALANDPIHIQTNTEYMRHFKCDPKVEVLGISISAFLNNLLSDDTRPYMAKYGLDNIQQDKWYSGQHYANVINDLVANTNAMENLVAVGMQIGKQFVFPPGEKFTYEQFLMSWDDLYHMHFRGGDVGNMKTTQLDLTSYRVVNTTIWPDDMVYGVAYGFGRRLLPPGSKLRIAYESPNHRMDYGGALETVMLVNWS